MGKTIYKTVSTTVDVDVELDDEDVAELIEDRLAEIKAPLAALTSEAGERPLFELSAALAREDLAEARHWLDRLAAEIGPDATEQVERARFMPQPHRKDPAR